MEIFTDNFQGSKLKSFQFQNDRLCSTQTHKHHDVCWNRIFKKQRIFLIFVDVVLKNSKFSPVYTWFTCMLCAWIPQKVSSDRKECILLYVYLIGLHWIVVWFHLISEIHSILPNGWRIENQPLQWDPT